MALSSSSSLPVLDRYSKNWLRKPASPSLYCRSNASHAAGRESPAPGKRKEDCDKDRVVRKTLVSYWFNRRKRAGLPARRYRSTSEFAALETLCCIPCQLFEFGVPLRTQVEAGKLVIPGFVGESGDGLAMDLLLFFTETILVAKVVSRS